jgi:hypothetical protein
MIRVAVRGVPFQEQTLLLLLLLLLVEVLELYRLNDSPDDSVARVVVVVLHGSPE